MAYNCSGEELVSPLVSLGTESPWGIQAVRDQPSGYVLSLCVKCTNGYDTQSLDNWNVTQKHQIITDPITVDIKPQFMDELPEYTRKYSSKNDVLTLVLPEILDEHPNNVTIDVIGIEATFDQGNLTLTNLNQSM